MNNYYYKKPKENKRKMLLRLFGIFLIVGGIFASMYTFFPMLSWQIYFAHAYSTEGLSTPIPKSTVVSNNTVTSLVANSKNVLTGVDYTNAQNWFPNVALSGTKATLMEYTLSIPKLSIKNAVVSAQDYDLTKHLVNYPGTPTPVNNGNSVIFGHSSLPQLFDEKDYQTIFATLYKMQIGDEFTVTVNDIPYTYKVFTVLVTDPTDTSIFEQSYDTSYVTLVTCTPPGTTWKRLIVRGRLQAL